MNNNQKSNLFLFSKNDSIQIWFRCSVGNQQRARSHQKILNTQYLKISHRLNLFRFIFLIDLSAAEAGCVKRA